MVGLVSPCLASEDAFQSLHRRYEGTAKFTKEATEAYFAVIEEQITDAEGDFTDTGAADRGGHEVIYSRWGDLAEELPHERAAKGKGVRLPEIVTVAASGVEVQVAMVGVSEQVGVEVVVVPYEGMLKVVTDGVQGYP